VLEPDIWTVTLQYSIFTAVLVVHFWKFKLTVASGTDFFAERWIYSIQYRYINKFLAYNMLSTVHHALVPLLDEVHLAPQVDTESVPEKKYMMDSCVEKKYRGMYLISQLQTLFPTMLSHVRYFNMSHKIIV
jgi:hypothetical protein